MARPTWPRRYPGRAASASRATRHSASNRSASCSGTAKWVTTRARPGTAGTPTSPCDLRPPAEPAARPGRIDRTVPTRYRGGEAGVSTPLRRTIEQRSAPILLALRRLPRWAPFLLVLALVLGG